MFSKSEVKMLWYAFSFRALAGSRAKSCTVHETCGVRRDCMCYLLRAQLNTRIQAFAEEVCEYSARFVREYKTWPICKQLVVLPICCFAGQWENWHFILRAGGLSRTDQASRDTLMKEENLKKKKYNSLSLSKLTNCIIINVFYLKRASVKFSLFQTYSWE